MGHPFFIYTINVATDQDGFEPIGIGHNIDDAIEAANNHALFRFNPNLKVTKDMLKVADPSQPPTYDGHLVAEVSEDMRVHFEKYEIDLSKMGYTGDANYGEHEYGHAEWCKL